MINYPDGLPYPQRDGNAHEPVSPMLRSPMVTGRAMQRKKYSAVPEHVPLTWIFSESQAQLFMAWYRDALNEGTAWALIPTKTPAGVMDYVARFTDIYRYSIVGVSHWRFTAQLELRERPILTPVGWAIYAPDYILHSNLLDIAINQKWPAA